MNDLAEIRRFWPKATTTLREVYSPTKNPLGPRSWYLSRGSDGEWLLSDWCEIAKTFVWHTGPTIAAAMAAAGFAQRPIGRYRETFNQYADRTQGKPVKHRAWHARRYSDKPVMPFSDTCMRHDDGTASWPVLLESRQRPRKKVRLGKRGRRLALAASLGEALDLVRQKRLDRGEVGQ